MSLTINPPTRSRRFRGLVIPLLGVAAAFVLVAVVGQSVLVHRMRLPRLTIDEGGNVIAVAITADGKTVFAGSDPTRDAMRPVGNKPADVFVYQADTGRLVRRLHGFFWRSNAVTSSPDGQIVVASGYTHADDSGPRKFQVSEVISWDWHSGRRLWAIPGDMPLSYSPDGRLIGSVGDLHDARSGHLSKSVSKAVKDDGQTAFSPDGRFFGFIGAPTLDKNGFSDSYNGDRLYDSTTRLHLWRTDTGKEVKDLPFTRVRAFDFSRDSRWLVLLCDQGMGGGIAGSVMRRVDLATGAVAWTRERNYNAPDHDPDAAFNCLVISPNGKYVVAESLRSQLVVLDAETGRELFRPFAHQDNGEPDWAIPGGLAFSADSRTLVSRCGRKVLVWDATSLR